MRSSNACLFCLNNNFTATGPVKNVIMHVKESTVRVTWQLPQCSGNIREIKVQYRKKGQSKWQWELKAATIADTEVIITGLEKGVEYEVRVVVVDTNGETYEMAEKSAAIDGKFSYTYITLSASSCGLAVMHLTQTNVFLVLRPIASTW